MAYNISKHLTSLHKTGVIGFGVALLLLGFASCSNEDYLGGHSITDGAGTQLSIKTTLRSTLWPDTEFAEDSEYGLSVIGYDDNTALNKKYFSKVDADSCGIPVYIKSTTKLFAYFPYMGEEMADPYDSISTLNQDNISPLFCCKSEAIDRTVSSTVNLEMNDFYGRLNLQITGPSDDVFKKYRLLNVGQVATINLRDGSMSVDTKKSDLTGTIINGNEASVKIVLMPTILSHEDNVRMIVYGEQRNYLVVFDTLRIVSDSLTAGTITLTKDAPGTYTPDDFSQWGDSESGGEYITGSGTVTFDKDVTGQWDKSSENDVSSDSVNKDVDVDHGNNGGTDDQHLTPAGAKVAEVRDTK